MKILQKGTEEDKAGMDKEAFESDGKLFEVETGRKGRNCVTLND